MNGTIISIEGTDGSGKHTQQQLLLGDLNKLGYKVFDQSFPNYGSRSAMPVQMYLDGELGDTANCLDAYEASVLYAVDRLCTYKKTIRPHYENGEIILFDRYVQSIFIHHTSRIADPNEKLKYLDFMSDLEYGKFHLPKPDLVFFIEMPVEKSLELAHARAELKNGSTKDILESDTEYMTNAYNNGINLAKKFGWTIIHCLDDSGNLKTIDAIHEEIMKIAINFLNSKNVLPRK